MSKWKIKIIKVPGPSGRHKGYKHSEETRAKMSKALKGKPSKRKGQKLSEQTRKKMSEGQQRSRKLKQEEKYMENLIDWLSWKFW